MSINDHMTDGLSLTSLGHPKMEKGKIPEENQVSRTSSSAAQGESFGINHNGSNISLTGPGYLADMFHHYQPVRALRSQRRYLLTKSAVRTKHGEASFSHYAAQLWNERPDSIKYAPTLTN